jgi:hypothetical protein
MNKHETTALEHHALGKGLLVMSNVIKREVSKVWRKMISSAIIRLCPSQLFPIAQKDGKTYNADSALEGDSKSVLIVALMDVEAPVGIEVRNRLAKLDPKFILCRHLGDLLRRFGI